MDEDGQSKDKDARRKGTAEMTKDEQEMLDECLAADHDHGPTNWEVEFLDSLDKDRDNTLTDKQLNCLEKINRKVLG